MGDPKTYFVLQSTDYAPNELIQLGQIITNPRIPYRRLAEPLRGVPSAPKIHSAPKKDWSFELSKGASGHLGVFARFLNVATARLSGSEAREFTQTWAAAELNTSFIELGEDKEYAKASVALKPVKDWLKENKILGKTVYMVTEIKVASQPGLATNRTAQEAGVSGELKGDPGTGGVAEVGADAGFEQTAGTAEEGQPAVPFVFAYRVRKVHISWRNIVTLGNDVEGADLHGRGRQGDSDSDDDSDSDEQDSVPKAAPLVIEDEIEGVLLGKSDFGPTLPARDAKFEAVDDDDGEECLVIVASE